MKKLLFFFILIFLVTGFYFYNKSTKEISLIQQKGSIIEMIIKGDSMEPTLKNGQKVKMDIDYYKTNSIQRNDIIVFKFITKDKPYIKRVIALSGDKLEFEDAGRFIDTTVPQNSYFVLSDNRANEIDSRQFGFLPEKHIIGKIIY